MKRIIFCALVVILCAPQFLTAQSYSVPAGDVYREEGIASWYGAEFDGRPTASGEIFNSTLFTAAHPSLPFGTFLIVTNKHNNRQVTVKVNDRGPFVASRIIDLSKAAADHIGMVYSGTAPVIIATMPATYLPAPEVQVIPQAAPAPAPYIMQPEPQVPAAIYAPEPAAPASGAFPYPPITLNVYPPAPAQPQPPAPAYAEPYVPPSPPIYVDPSYLAIPPPMAPDPYMAAPSPPPLADPYASPPPPPPLYTDPYASAPPPPPLADPYAAVPPPAPPPLAPPSSGVTYVEVPLPPPPSGGLKLIPSINPQPNAMYRLQVGSYKAPRNAVDAFDKLKRAGLNPSYEQNGEYYRVVLSGVRGAEIPMVTDKLEKAGFREAIIRAE